MLNKHWTNKWISRLLGYAAHSHQMTVKSNPDGYLFESLQCTWHCAVLGTLGPSSATHIREGKPRSNDLWRNQNYTTAPLGFIFSGPASSPPADLLNTNSKQPSQKIRWRALRFTVLLSTEPWEAHCDHRNTSYMKWHPTTDTGNGIWSECHFCVNQ